MESKDKPPWRNLIFFSSKPQINNLQYKPFISDVPNVLLNKKEEITIFEEEHKWELAKKMANPYEMVYTQEEKFPRPIISSIKPLSRSYFKMVEMLYSINFYKDIKDKKHIRSAHIAEGPGGFMQAFIDVSEQHKKTVKSMHAITLKSDKYYIPGWKKATNFLKRYADIIHICYGKDGTGDIYIKENQTFFLSTLNHKVDLFTADGGFDFSFDYTQQEKQIFPLLVCSFILALQSLAINGTCIIKLFDTYSVSTQSLISLCGSCFKEYTLYKPATSRPCNSERYFIGKKFKGSDKVLSTLRIIYECTLKDLYPIINIEESEKAYIKNISDTYEQTQIICIDLAKQFALNTDLFNNYYHEYYNKSKEFCEEFHIPIKIKST